NADGGRDGDRHAHRDADRDANGGRDGDRDEHRDADCNADGGRHGDRDAYGDPDCNADGGRHGDRDAYGDTDCNADGGRDGDPDAHGDADRNADGGRDGDRNADGDADRNADGRRDVDRGTVTVGVSGCAGSSRPCGVCNILGPVDNLQADAGEINDHRCTGDTRTKCTTNADCSVATGTCEYYFGSNLPLTAGGVSTCVSNQINGTITGTANIETGSAASSVQLISRVYTGPNPNPCPRCVGDGTPNDNVRA